VILKIRFSLLLLLTVLKMTPRVTLILNPRMPEAKVEAKRRGRSVVRRRRATLETAASPSLFSAIID
jgi:hypothetical protein